MTDEWVRVLDESELQPGMAVRWRPCGMCEREHAGILLQRSSVASECDFCGHCSEWWSVGHADDSTSLCEVSEIRDGTIYRLRDLPAEETTTVVTRRPARQNA